MGKTSVARDPDFINAHLAERGLLLREGTMADATLIAAPPFVSPGQAHHAPEGRALLSRLGPPALGSGR